MMETQMFTELKNMDDPEKFFSVHLENDYYEAKIRYLSKSYRKHFEEGKICRDDILIKTKPKKRHMPELIYLIHAAPPKGRIGISFPDGMFIDENELEQFSEAVAAAYATIREIKRVINQYFPGVLDGFQENE